MDQPDEWEPTPLNYDSTPEDLLDMCFSRHELSMTDASSMDAPHQQMPETSSYPYPGSHNELASLVAEGVRSGKHPASCDVSPMGSFTELDGSQDNAVFSALPSRSTTESSVSSVDQIKTPLDNDLAPSLSLVEELDMICQDPIEGFEGLEANESIAKSPQTFVSFLHEPGRFCQEPAKEDHHSGEAMSIWANQIMPSPVASLWMSGSDFTADHSFSSSTGYFHDMLYKDL
jgi:hypothetical protein